MEDRMVSLKAVIDALGERPLVWSNDDEYALGERNQYDSDKLAIEAVPSVQPVARDINVLSNDLISRQAAIDALGKEGLITAMVIIDRVPSAQPYEELEPFREEGEQE